MKFTDLKYLIPFLMLVVLPIGIAYVIVSDAQKLYDKCEAACAHRPVIKCEKEYALCNTQSGMVPIK
jgi:hypothetical protein